MEREQFNDLAVKDQAELGKIKAAASASKLYNEDLAPAGPEERTWTTYTFVALWVGISIVITTYTLASGLIAAGMIWWQALFTIGLEAVMNSIKNCLGMRKTWIAKTIGRPWNSRFYGDFIQVHNTL
ncbi:hypothetical protein BH24ACT22_BH24ACT22_04200 [soil metagenome]